MTKLSKPIREADLMVCTDCGALLIKETVDYHTDWHTDLDRKFRFATVGFGGFQ